MPGGPVPGQSTRPGPSEHLAGDRRSRAGRHERRLDKIAAVESGEGARSAVRRETALLARRRVSRRIWAHDPTVFVADGETNEAARKSILNRLGWLRAPESLASQVADV